MADSPSLSLLKNNNEHVGGYIGFVNKLRTITLRILLQTDAECWEDPEEGSSRAENVCFAVSDMLTYSQWDEVTDEEINLYLTDPDYDEDAE
jgi:hypothetical protein